MLDPEGRQYEVQRTLATGGLLGINDLTFAFVTGQINWREDLNGQECIHAGAQPKRRHEGRRA